MTETHFFYTDPLAAAWMAKHFGMRFSDVDGNPACAYAETDDLEDVTFAREGVEDGVRGWFPTDRAFIHPESLYLLEPQPGDVLMRDGMEKYIGDNNQFLFVTPAPDTEWLLEAFHRCNGRIVRRDGKPFFWPERGAA